MPQISRHERVVEREQPTSGRFNYGDWDVTWRQNMMGYIVWSAHNKKLGFIGDHEGGDLGYDSDGEQSVIDNITDFIKAFEDGRYLPSGLEVERF